MPCLCYLSFMSLKFSNIYKKTSVLKSKGLKVCKFIKKRLHHRSFPLNIAYTCGSCFYHLTYNITLKTEFTAAMFLHAKQTFFNVRAGKFTFNGKKYSNKISSNILSRLSGISVLINTLFYKQHF